MVPGKWSPENWSSEKWSPEKCPLKLLSVKRMLGNLNDFFIYFDWFYYTHKKVFDVHLTILHAPNCRTLKRSRKVCCRVLGFHRLITSQHSTHVSQCSTLTPRFFGSEFSGTIFPGTIFPGFACVRVFKLWKIQASESQQSLYRSGWNSLKENATLILISFSLIYWFTDWDFMTIWMFCKMSIIGRLGLNLGKIHWSVQPNSSS